MLTLDLLGLGAVALTLTRSARCSNPLLEYVDVRKRPQAGTLDLTAPGGLRPALEVLVRHKGVTRFAGGVEPVYAIGGTAPGGGLLTQRISLLRHRAITEAGDHPLVRDGLRGEGDLGARGLGRGAAAARHAQVRVLLPPPSPSSPRRSGRAGHSSPRLGAQGGRSQLLRRPVWAERPLLLGKRVLGSFLEGLHRGGRPAHRPTPRAPVDERLFLDECIGWADSTGSRSGIHSASPIPRSVSKGPGPADAEGPAGRPAPGADPGDVARRRRRSRPRSREVVNQSTA